MDRSSPRLSGIQFVFLDRDGVINRKPPEGEYVSKWEDFHFLPGAERAIAALNASGRTIIVITNQRGIALGLYTEDEVRLLHCQLQDNLFSHHARIDAFYYCPHDNNQCSCRKPATGLFEQALHDFPRATSRNSIVIGDSISDIQAARSLSLPSIFISGNHQNRKPGSEQAASLANFVTESLAEAVERYLPRDR